jgi:radical SAM protein with 4Fe4S-binding SPASM domain
LKAHLNLTKNILASNMGRLAFPYKLTFCITYWCNYKCKTCNIWQRKPQNELSLDEIAEFFSKSNRFNWIDFTGGEVWLRKDFTDIVEAAIRNCSNLLMVHFPTNGYMTDQIVTGVERIVRMRPPKLTITVSTDGDEKVNDYVRGIEGGWRRQIETYKRLHAIRGVDVFLGMTLSSLNADQYDKAFAAAKAECPWLTPDDFHMNVAHESGHYYGNLGSGMLGGRKQIVDQVDHYRSLRKRFTPISLLERRYLKHAKTYLRTGFTPMRCHALNSSCFVDSWGDVYPCGMYDAKIGSLRDYGYDLGVIWDLPRTRQLQKEIWDYSCPQCWTPCEAYQSILGNLFGQGNTARKTQKAGSRKVPVAGEGD